MIFWCIGAYIESTRKIPSLPTETAMLPCAAPPISTYNPSATLTVCSSIAEKSMFCARGAENDHVTIVIDVDAVPLLDGALELVAANTPGGGRTNAQHFGRGVRADDSLDERRVQLLYDPQTSGGLLAAIAPEAATDALGRLALAGVEAQVVGRVDPRSEVALHLRRMV